MDKSDKRIGRWWIYEILRVSNNENIKCGDCLLYNYCFTKGVYNLTHFKEAKEIYNKLLREDKLKRILNEES